MKDAARTFKVLSDPMRLRIVLLLMGKDLCVCELMHILRMEQTRLSHQLRTLRHAGMVEDVRQGRWMIYRIRPGARKILETLSRTILRHALKESADVLRDVKRMDICMREEIRRKRGSRSKAAQGPGRRVKG